MKMRNVALATCWKKKINFMFYFISVIVYYISSNNLFCIVLVDYRNPECDH